MIYFYTVSYDEVRDDFYGIVDGPKVVLFEITSTKQMIEYIKSGVMKHIDDIDGLEKFLREKNKLGKGDGVALCNLTTY